MKTAYSYIRFSSKKQELGDSLRRQVALAVDYAAKHGLDLDDHSYRDLGVSAFKGKNATEGALGTILRAIEQGVIKKGSYLLVESLDRLSRDEVDEALELFLRIIRSGIVLVTVDDGVEYSKETIKGDWTKLIIALAVMSRGHNESSLKSTRVATSWAEKRSSGEIMTRMAPAWLKVVERDGKLKFLVDKPKADIVRKVFKLAVQGHGTPTIARLLNRDGVPTTGGKATEWSAGLVAAVLRKRGVIGTLVSKGEVLEDYYPAIVKKETFYAVQEMVNSRASTGGGNKRENISNLLSGIGYCECGRKVRFVGSSGQSKYLRCLSAYAGTGCDAPQIPYHAVEQAVFGLMIQSEDVAKGLIVHTGQDPVLVANSELADAKVRLERLYDLVEQGSKNVGPRVAKLEAEIAVLEKNAATAIPHAPLTDRWLDTLLLIGQHDMTVEEEGDANPIRVRIQAALRRMITKVVFDKATKQYESEGQVYRYRDMTLHGDVEQVLVAGSIGRLVKSGGVAVPYLLPLKGFQPGNVRGSR